MFFTSKNNSAHYVQKVQYVSLFIVQHVKQTVKLRKHYGASSLDLTVPSNIVKKKNLNPGDIFELTIKKENDKLILIYKLVYQP